MNVRRTSNRKHFHVNHILIEYAVAAPVCSYISVIIWILLLCFSNPVKSFVPLLPEAGRAFQLRETEALRVTFVLTEESPIGTKIGNVLHSLRNSNSPTEYKLPQSRQLLELKSNKYLALNGTTGDLYVQSRIDRESLCRDVGTCCTSGVHTVDDTAAIRPQFQTVQNSKLPEPVFLNCFLRMLVLQNPSSEHFIEVIVYILDVNDNPPRWAQTMLDLEIPEHVPIGSLYKLPEATDPDQGPVNAVVSYRLFTATYNPQNAKVRCLQCPDRDLSTSYSLPVSPQQNPYFFSLESQLVDNTISSGPRFNLHLRVDSDLDREKQTTHYLILLATDGLDEFDQSPHWSLPASSGGANTALYRSKHTGTLTIKVTVLDKNDHSPVFVDSKPTVTVAENTKPGTIIYQAVARDADLIDRTALVYSISTSASPEVLRCFAINQSTGEVYIKHRLYFPNASVLPDTGQKSALHYSGKSSIFGYIIPLQVSDRLHHAEATLTVQLTQVNTQPPTISISSHLRMSSSGDQLWIAEDTPADSIVAMINVLDPDKPLPSSTEEEMLSSGVLSTTGRPQCFTNHDHFVIRPLMVNTASEFKLILRKSLDREVSDSHSLRIECWDAGTPPLSAEMRLFVRVEDIDDSPPQFERPMSLVSIKEGLPPHTLITRVQAIDADLGKNALIAYRIVSQVYIQTQAGLSRTELTSHVSPDKPLVSIDKHTGEIFNEVIFDRETLDVINCTVEAYSPQTEEKPSTPGALEAREKNFKSHMFIVINIEDINDCAPQFNLTSYEFTILEGQQPHYQIGRVYATDKDAEAPNNLIRYSMRPISGPIGQLAKLYVTISADGVLYTQQNQLDREQTPVLSFEVVATDSGRPSMSAFANVLIRVLDANDNSPVWLFPKQYGSRTTVNISQQATVGFQLAQIKAIDLDDGVNGEVIYSIIHGNEDGFFEVDPLNGALYLAKSLHNFISNDTKSTVPIGIVQYENRSHMTDEKRRSQGKLELLGSSQKQFYQHRLVLKASDRGQPQRFNTTVLDILIFAAGSTTAQGGTDTHKYRAERGRHGSTSAHEFARILDQDLVIMVVLIALTSVISVILIMAICLIRCRQIAGTRQVQRNMGSEPGLTQTIEKQTIRDRGRTWWNSSLSFIHRGRKRDSKNQINSCHKSSMQDLYVVSSTVCDEDLRHSEQLPDATGRNTPGTEAYFAICPGTWNSRTRPKGACSLGRDTDPYRTLSSTPDKLSSTYVVELNPTMFDQPYALIRPQPCTSSTQDNVHYQTLFSDRGIGKGSPSHLNTCPVKGAQATELSCRNGMKNTDLELQPVEANSLLLSHLALTEQRSPCRTCDRQILQTFACNKPPSNKTPEIETEELEC